MTTAVNRRKFLGGTTAGAALAVFPTPFDLMAAAQPLATELSQISGVRELHPPTIHSALWKEALHKALREMQIKDVVLLFESLRDPARAEQRVKIKLDNAKNKVHHALQASEIYSLGAWIVDTKRKYSLANDEIAEKTLDELGVSHAANALLDLSEEVFQRLGQEYNTITERRSAFIDRFNEISDRYSNLTPKWEAKSDELLFLVDQNPFTEILKSEASRLGTRFDQQTKDWTGRYGYDLARRFESGIWKGVEKVGDDLATFRNVEQAITDLARRKINEIVPDLDAFRNLDNFAHRSLKQNIVSGSRIAGTLVGFIDRRAGHFIQQAAPAVIQAYETANSLMSGASLFSGVAGVASTMNFVGAGLAIGGVLAGLFGGGGPDPEVMEKLAEIQESIDQLNKKVDVIDKKLDIVIGRLDEIVSKLDIIDQKLDVINQKLGQVLEGLKGVNRNIGILDQKLNQQRKILIGITKFLGELNRQANTNHQEVLSELKNISEDIGVLIQFSQNELHSQLNIVKGRNETIFARRERLIGAYDLGDTVRVWFLEAINQYNNFIRTRSFDPIFRPTDAGPLRHFDAIGDNRNEIDHLVAEQSISRHCHLITEAVDWIKREAIPNILNKDGQEVTITYGSFWSNNARVQYPDPEFWLKATSGYYELKEVVPEYNYRTQSGDLEDFINEFQSRKLMTLVDNNALRLAVDIYMKIFNKIIDQMLYELGIRQYEISPNLSKEDAEANMRDIFMIGSYYFYLDKLDVPENERFRSRITSLLLQLDKALNALKIIALATYGVNLDAKLSKQDRHQDVIFLSDKESSIRAVLENFPGSKELRVAFGAANRPSNFFDAIKIAAVNKKTGTTRNRDLNKVQQHPEYVVYYVYDFEPIDDAGTGYKYMSNRIYSPDLLHHSIQTNDALIASRTQGIKEFEQSTNIANLADLAL